MFDFNGWDTIIVTMIMASADAARLPTRPSLFYFPDLYR